MNREFIEAIGDFEIGSEINVRFVKINSLVINENIYAIMADDEEVEIEKRIWIKFNRSLLVDYLTSTSSKVVLDLIKDNQGRTILANPGYFLSDIDIEGKVDNVSVKVNEEKELQVKAIVVSEIKDSNQEKREFGGAYYSKGENSSFALLSEKLKNKLADALKPYIKNKDVFDYLNNKLNHEIPLGEGNEFVLIKCSNCGQPEIYNEFEIYNKHFCRGCHNSKFKSLIEVPYSDTMLIHVFSIYNEILQQYVHRGKTIPQDLINQIESYFGVSSSRKELSLMYRYVDSLVKKKFMPERHKVYIKLEKIVNEAKQKDEGKFNELFKHLDKFSSERSLYITREILKVYENISSKISKQYLNWYYPHPVISELNEDHSLFMEKEYLYDDINNIMNLYKDTFDIVPNHWFMCNIARILKGKKIKVHCVTEKMYGHKLLQTTKDYVQGTDFETIVEESYNILIRNSTAHPARSVDVENEVVKLYKDDQAQEFKLNEILIQLTKLLTLHLELVAIKHKLGLEAERDFTEGVLSLETDFIQKLGDKERPYLIVNQLYPFKEFAPSKEWWKNNLTLSKVEKGGELGLQISVNRPSTSTTKFEVEYQISPHIEKWISMALDHGEVMVVHRFCHLLLDREELEEIDGGMHEEIYVYRSNKLHTYFVGQFEEAGLYTITDKLQEELQMIVEENKH
ncbi:hypothetical protein ABEY24_20670 [Peribacillus frigoritolerans]|uniref:hypothetical protein n=1 Tax=Peribacillus frigoritolerans TaxID=450367 RepID=UPI003D2B7B0D